jgi:ketosteroid isomerase-like protein
VAGKEAKRVGGLVGVDREIGTVESRGAEAVARHFARAMLARDPRAAATCFSSGARILTADGTEVIGRENVMAVLRQITSSAQNLEIRIGRCIVAEDVASCTQFWRRSSSGTPIGGYEDATAARLVLARSARRWEIAIASPWE